MSSGYDDFVILEHEKSVRSIEKIEFYMISSFNLWLPLWIIMIRRYIWWNNNILFFRSSNFRIYWWRESSKNVMLTTIYGTQYTRYLNMPVTEAKNHWIDNKHSKIALRNWNDQLVSLLRFFFIALIYGNTCIPNNGKISNRTLCVHTILYVIDERWIFHWILFSCSLQSLSIIVHAFFHSI